MADAKVPYETAAADYSKAAPGAEIRPQRWIGHRFSRVLLAIFGAYVVWNAVQDVARVHMSVSGSSPPGRFGLVAPKVLPVGAHSDLCPQAESLSPSEHADLDATLMGLYAEEEYQTRAFKALGGAIQIPCVLHYYVHGQETNIRTQYGVL